MNADGMVDYYEPLYEWLKEENARLGLKSGWDPKKTEFYPYEEMDFIGVCENEEKSEIRQAPENFLKRFMKP